MQGHEGRETSVDDSDCGDGVQTGNACVVCWRSPTDRAHLIDRSLAPDPYWDPARLVFLCREHHDAYDAHELDLLPYLEPRHRHELARAVEVFGLIGTLERVTGMHWTGAVSHA
jgi:5-methylcytosine-specific restriction endonuclease McrA